jgi:hypothetical protein
MTGSVFADTPGMREPLLKGRRMSKELPCTLFRNGHSSGDIVIEFEDDPILSDRSGGFLIPGTIDWPPTDQFELQPSGGVRIPIVVTKQWPAPGGTALAFCSLLSKWD